MIKASIKFIGLLAIIMISAFAIHLLVLSLIQLPLYENKIISAYSFNFIFGVLVVLALTFLQDKAAGSLGFIFMGSSLVKFLFYFAIFNSVYKADGEVSRLEFAAFFIPYSISLIVEVIFLSKTLNK